MKVKSELNLQKNLEKRFIWIRTKNDNSTVNALIYKEKIWSKLKIKNFRFQQINSANGIIPLIFYLLPAGQLPGDFLQSIQNLEDP
jgi:hypothetical protein